MALDVQVNVMVVFMICLKEEGGMADLIRHKMERFSCFY